MSKNPKNGWKLMKIANINRESFHSFSTTWGISMTFSGKMEDLWKTDLWWKTYNNTKSKKARFQSLFRRYINRIASHFRVHQDFWLNLINLWTFFKINPWFNGHFKFFMGRTYSILSVAFQLFQFSFFQVKMVNNYDLHVIFQDIGHQLQENNTSWNFPQILKYL